MKGWKKHLVFILSFVMIFSLLVGCSGSMTNEMGRDGRAPEYDAVMESTDEASFGNGSTGSGSPLEPDKVITNISINIQTTEFEKSTSSLNELIGKYEGYVESSNISYNSYYNSKSYRYGDYVVRVPKNKVENFKTDLAVLGHITSENTHKQDVTKQYTDTESRLNILEVKQERILELLEKATEIEDIIKLEDQLSQTIYEIENLKGSLLSLDDKIEFSTFHLGIQEVEKLSKAETVDTSFGEKILNAINDSIYSFKNTLERLIILAIHMLPFIVLIGLVAYIAGRLFRKYRDKDIDKK